MVINIDYPGFLSWLYASDPELEFAEYKDQEIARADSLFGVSDGYCRAFSMLGHQAREIDANNLKMQAAWAREHGLAAPEVGPGERRNGLVLALKRRLRKYRNLLFPLAQRLGLVPSLDAASTAILLAQIEDYDPDVILNQDLAVISSKMMKSAMRGGRLLVAQCGIDPPPGLDLSPYDFGVSLLPWVVEVFEKKGLPARQWHLAFNGQVLEKLGAAAPKDIAISFVGSVNADHARRIKLLEAVAERYPLTLHLSSESSLPKNSPLWAIDQGPLWGRQMYDVVRRSKITLNSHVGAARGMAGNMRLYEATGVGTFLLTDHQANLETLFEPGRHVGAYNSVEDCLKQIEIYLSDDKLREQIARAGQAHTLATHTYLHRAKQFLGFIEGLPSLPHVQ